MISERNGKDAKLLFEKKDYEEAIKKYKLTLNITENLEKKRYSEEEHKELDEINRKAKTNFLRCFIKLHEYDEAASELAEKCSKQLLEKERNQLHLLLRVKTLAQRKYIDDSYDLALEMVKEYPND